MSAGDSMAHLPKASHHHAKASSDALDTEMTSPLTSNDSSSARSRSPSKSPFKGMSPIDNQKYSRPGNFARTNTAPNPMAASWRRDSYTTGPTGPPDMGSYTSPPNMGSYTAPPNMNPYTSSSNMGSYGAAQYDPNYPIMPGPYENARPRGNSMMGENHVPLSSVRPGPVWPSEAQLSMAYGYGIQRDDGTITRLIRADELDEMHAVPRSQGPEGLIILPPPRQFSPSRRPGPEQMVPSNVLQQLPQNRVRRPTFRAQHDPNDATQMHIDTIVAQANMTPPARPMRREKIYCDKWIHEGVCAFTQMGCKYKHEMPMDKATQLSLGLNHGIPNWYRRAYGVSSNSPDATPALPSTGSPNNNNQNRADGPWRRLEAPPTNGSSSSTNGTNGNATNCTQSGNPASGKSHCGYGVIGPPLQNQSTFSNNPYANLKVEDHEDDEEEDDTITYRGRRQ